MDFTLYNSLRKVIDWVAPRTCMTCSTPHITGTRPCCDACYQLLPFQSHYCHQCGQPYSSRDGTCGQCIAKPPYYDECFCPFEYAEPISATIINLKYHDKPQLARSLGQLLAYEVNQQGLLLPELLVPVPMHLSGLRKRGYNQSTQIAKAVGKQLDIPVSYNMLSKHKKTESQTKQSLTQRKINVRGSFSMKKNCRAQSVAIIDDVVTTGATVGEIAKILKKNGVDYIQVWGVTHTL